MDFLVTMVFKSLTSHYSSARWPGHHLQESNHQIMMANIAGVRASILGIYGPMVVNLIAQS